MEDIQESNLILSGYNLEIARFIINNLIDNTLFLITELESDKNENEEVILLKNSHFNLDTELSNDLRND